MLVDKCGKDLLYLLQSIDTFHQMSNKGRTWPSLLNISKQTKSESQL